MSKTTEVCFDISTGVLTFIGTTIFKGTLISEDCVNADQPVTQGNIKYVTIEDAIGTNINDVVVLPSTVSQFVYIGAYDRLPDLSGVDASFQYGDFVTFEI